VILLYDKKKKILWDGAVLNPKPELGARWKNGGRKSWSEVSREAEAEIESERAKANPW